MIFEVSSVLAESVAGTENIAGSTTYEVDDV
jgi:hypothetical protein